MSEKTPKKNEHNFIIEMSNKQIKKIPTKETKFLKE